MPCVRFAVRFVALASVVLWATIAAEPLLGGIYQNDGGTADGLTFPPINTTGYAIQSFQIQPDMQTLTGVQVQWGAASADTSTEVFLWTDPNNDGNPEDAVVARTLAVTIPLHDNLEPPPVIDYVFDASLTLPLDGWFFVGARLHQSSPTAAQAWWGVDLAPPHSERSWFVAFAGEVFGGDLSGGLLNQFVDGDFNVRALAVPEPSTLLLAAFGVLGLIACGWRRQRRRLIR
jgi:hypothetical protein